jgi:hypothetical protein
LAPFIIIISFCWTKIICCVTISEYSLKSIPRTDLPVSKDSIITNDNVSEHQVTLADMDIIDNISGDYGRIVHDNDDSCSFGHEMDTSYNLI